MPVLLDICGATANRSCSAETESALAVEQAKLGFDE
jgi:hypothetical protein